MPVLTHTSQFVRRLVFGGFLAMSAAIGAELPAALKPYAERFDQDNAALNAARDAQLKLPRDRYRTALGVAQKNAAAAGKTAELDAVKAEIEGVDSGTVPEMYPPNLPHQLAQDRRAYMLATANVARALPPRQRDLATKYLRTLAAFEANALKSMDTAMTEAVAAEKQRATALINASSGKPRNAVVNGDFSEGDVGALPAGWKLEGGESAVADATLFAEGTEKFLRFQRKFVQKRADLVQVKELVVPDKAKALEYSVRIRVKGLSAGTGYNMNPGVHFVGRDGSEQDVCNTWASAKQDAPWRKFTGKLDLPGAAKTVRVIVGPFGSVGTIDFDDLEVTFR